MKRHIDTVGKRRSDSLPNSQYREIEKIKAYMVFRLTIQDKSQIHFKSVLSALGFNRLILLDY
jgi:hypothetical protein